MKRKLFTQLCNQWRSNTWIAIELLIVSVIICYIMNLLVGIVFLRMENGKAYDVTDCLVVSYSRVPKESPEYITREDEKSGRNDDLATIIARIKDNPEVEYVGTGSNAIPYNYNYYGRNLFDADGGDSITYNGNCRYMSPEMVEILKLRGIAGETPQQLVEILKRGEILVSDYMNDPDGSTARSMIGRRVRFDGDSTAYRVGGAIKAVTRNDYEPAFGGSIIMPTINEEKAGWYGDEIAVRVKPGMARGFKQKFQNDMERMYRTGNTYVYDINLIEDRRDMNQMEITNMVRNTIICIVFILASVFLGLLGTFWFRTQQRVSEIAIRKVAGATPLDIFRRLMSEGMLLLLLVTPLAIVIDFLVKYYELSIDFVPDAPWSIVVTSICATFALLATIILVGIYFPASKAMKIEPAIALKDE